MKIVRHLLYSVILLFCGLIVATASPKKGPQITEILERVVTANQTELTKLSKDSIQAFLNHHYMGRVRFDMPFSELQVSHNANSPFEELHIALGEKLDGYRDARNSDINAANILPNECKVSDFEAGALYKNVQFTMDTLAKTLPAYSDLDSSEKIEKRRQFNLSNLNSRLELQILGDLDAYDEDRGRLAKNVQGSFVEGNAVFIRQQLACPLIGVSLYSRASVADFVSRPNNKEVKKQKWCVPWEQAFLMSNLGQYRNALALPKFWDSYSDALLIHVPAGSYITMVMGLVNDQSFPRLAVPGMGPYAYHHLDPFQHAELKATQRNNFMDNESLFRSCFERCDGGAMQMYIDGVSKCYMYPLKLLRGKQKQYVAKHRAGDVSHWIKPQKQGHDLHLIDEGYDDIEIDLIAAMNDLVGGMFRDEDVKKLRSLRHQINGGLRRKY